MKRDDPVLTRLANPSGPLGALWSGWPLLWLAAAALPPHWRNSHVAPQSPLTTWAGAKIQGGQANMDFETPHTSAPGPRPPSRRFSAGHRQPQPPRQQFQGTSRLIIPYPRARATGWWQRHRFALGQVLALVPLGLPDGPSTNPPSPPPLAQHDPQPLVRLVHTTLRRG